MGLSLNRRTTRKRRASGLTRHFMCQFPAYILATPRYPPRAMDRDASGRPAEGLTTDRGLAASASGQLEQAVADLLAELDAQESALRQILADDRVATRLARQFRRAERDPRAPSPPADARQTPPGLADGNDRHGRFDLTEMVGRPELLKEIPIPHDATTLAALHARLHRAPASEWRSVPATGHLPHPDPAEIPSRVDGALDALHAHERHPLVASALALGEILAIRPFPRGNLRTARIVSRAIAFRGGYTFAAYVPWRVGHERPEIERALRESIESADPLPWARRSLEEAREACKRILDQARYVARFVDELNERQWRIGQWFRDQSGESPDRTWRFREIQAAFPWIAPRTLKRDLARLRDLEILNMEGRLKSARYRYTAGE